MRLITNLIQEVQKPNCNLSSHPLPTFASKIKNQYSPQENTPPRSPSGERFMGRTLGPKSSA